MVHESTAGSAAPGLGRVVGEENYDCAARPGGPAAYGAGHRFTRQRAEHGFEDASDAHGLIVTQARAGLQRPERVPQAPLVGGRIP